MKHFAVVSILLAILVSSLSAQDAVHLRVGWNIIGSVMAGAVPDVLSTIPERSRHLFVENGIAN